MFKTQNTFNRWRWKQKTTWLTLHKCTTNHLTCLTEVTNPVFPPAPKGCASETRLESGRVVHYVEEDVSKWMDIMQGQLGHAQLNIMLYLQCLGTGLERIHPTMGVSAIPWDLFSDRLTQQNTDDKLTKLSTQLSPLNIDKHTTRTV